MDAVLLVCLEPRPSLRIVEDADLVAAEALQKNELTSSQRLSITDGSSGDSDNDPLDKVTSPGIPDIE